MPDEERRRRGDARGRHRRHQAPRTLARRPAGLAGTMTCRARPRPGVRAAGAPLHRRSRPAAPRSRPAPARPGRPRLRPAGTRRSRWPRHSRGCRRARMTRTAAKAGRSPRSSPQNRTEAAARSRARLRSAAALVHAGRAQLDDHPAGLGRQAQPLGQVAERAAQRGQRGSGIGRAAGVHGQRVHLVLDPGTVRGAGPAEHARQFPAGGLNRRRGSPARSARRPATAASRSGRGR